MKKILIILFSFLSLVGFTQELKYTNPRKIVEKVNNTQGKIFNVLDYGAVMDDGNADNTALIAAIAASRPNGIVYIPKGTLTINLESTAVWVYDSIIIRGSGKYATIIQAIPATALHEKYVFECYAGSKSRFEDMTIRSCVTSNATYDIVGIRNNNSSGGGIVDIERVNFYGFYNSVEIYPGMKTIKLKDCEITSHNRTSNGIYIKGGNDSAFVYVEDCYFHDIGKIASADHGIYVSDPVSLIVENTKFRNIPHGSGIQSWGSGSHKGSTKRIDGCIFDSCKIGIITNEADTLQMTTITNCSFTNIFWDGIYMGVGSHIITGNTFINNYEYSIYSSANNSRAIISNNIFRLVATGIYQSQTDNIWNVTNNMAFNISGGSVKFVYDWKTSTVYTSHNRLFYLPLPTLDGDIAE